MKILACLCLWVTVVYGTRPSYPYSRPRPSFHFNGCFKDNGHLPHIQSEVGAWFVDRCDWQSEKLWSYLMDKWYKLRSDHPDILKEWRMYEGACNHGKTDRICRVCSDADDVSDCILNGHTEECEPGQDACVMEHIDGRYHRRCGHKCECLQKYSYSSDVVVTKDFYRCHNAGCKEYGCAAVGCSKDYGLLPKFFGDSEQPSNSAFEADGSECRCDEDCQVPAHRLMGQQRNPPVPSGDADTRPCCKDVCMVCGMSGGYMNYQCRGGRD